MKRFLFVMALVALVLFAYHDAQAQCCDGVTQCGPSGSHIRCTTTCSAPLAADQDTGSVSGCVDLSPVADACVGGGATASTSSTQPAEHCVCVAGQCFWDVVCHTGCAQLPFDPFQEHCRCLGRPGTCVRGVCVLSNSAVPSADCAALVEAACADAGNTTTSCVPDPSCP
jgi:hypothetical protein